MTFKGFPCLMGYVDCIIVPDYHVLKCYQCSSLKPMHIFYIHCSLGKPVHAQLVRAGKIWCKWGRNIIYTCIDIVVKIVVLFSDHRACTHPKEGLMTSKVLQVT